MKYRYLVILVSLFFVLGSCTTQNKLNKLNVAKNYMEDFSGKFMQEQIFHINDSISELSVRIQPLLIPQLKEKKLELYSYLNLTYAVYSSFNKKDIIQADAYKLSELLTFDQVDKQNITLTIPLKMEQNQPYLVLVSLQDPINKTNYLKYIRIVKTDEAAENYKVLDENGKILWQPWLNGQKRIRIQYRYHDAKSIFLSYFQPKFSPALPPYSDVVPKEFLTDKSFESFELQLINGESSLMELPRKGLYRIHSKKEEISGKTILQLYDEYPSISSDAQKVFGLRYLTPQKEFATMLQSEPVSTLKEFWFFEERTEERSKEMMRTYYARMLRANHLFTSYKEGWKTDRGMIFMVYGPPDHVYHEADREVWEYGPDANYNDLRFDFVIRSSKLHNQQWVLERNSSYKRSWYLMLENWRNN